MAMKMPTNSMQPLKPVLNSHSPAGRFSVKFKHLIQDKAVKTKLFDYQIVKVTDFSVLLTET